MVIVNYISELGVVFMDIIKKKLYIPRIVKVEFRKHSLSLCVQELNL